MLRAIYFALHLAMTFLGVVLAIHLDFWIGWCGSYIHMIIMVFYNRRSIDMTDFNWCHGPECHKKHTVDRVRGVKGSKVLRTRKIKINGWNSDGQWGFFCSNHCQNDFWKTYATQIVAIAPRTECLETPINDPQRS